METWRHRDIKQKTKTEAQAIFLNPFTVCSSYERKFVVCPVVDIERNGSYPFATGLNGINRLNGLAHLWQYLRTDSTVTCGQHLRAKLTVFYGQYIKKQRQSCPLGSTV
jgi:hypothetical protein